MRFIYENIPYHTYELGVIASILPFIGVAIVPVSPAPLHIAWGSDWNKMGQKGQVQPPLMEDTGAQLPNQDLDATVTNSIHSIQNKAGHDLNEV